MLSIFIRLCILLFFSACVCRSKEYRDFYSHLQKPHSPWPLMQPTEYFLIILVDARHLDYTKGENFCHSVAKHPSDGSKNGDVGHAWIYLQGKRGEQIITFEGGHSGERGDDNTAKYFDGIMNYNDFGQTDRVVEPFYRCYEPNPIKYLWHIREDGFFQRHSGGHRPTFAAKISLSPEKFEKIFRFIQSYPYKYYSLLGSQCSSFVTQIAEVAGFPLESEISMKILPRIYYGGRWVRLWENPSYATLTFATPDMIEKSLISAVESGKAEYALPWYLEHCLF